MGKHVMERLRVEDDSVLPLTACKMSQELGWSKEMMNKEMRDASKTIMERKEMQGWRQFNETIATELAQINIDVIEKGRGTFKQLVKKEADFVDTEELQGVLRNHKPFISEENLWEALRHLDIYRNGKLSEDEFVLLMSRFYVKTPEEVVEEHVQQFIKSFEK